MDDFHAEGLGVTGLSASSVMLRSGQAGDAGVLDVSALRKKSFRQWLIGIGLRVLFSDLCTRLLRRFWPIIYIRNVALVTRFTDVQEVLNHDRIFTVKEERVQVLNRGRGFLLGMQDGPDYRRTQAQVMAAFKRADMPRIAAIVSGSARSLVDDSQKCIDGVAGLITQTCIDVCERYYGVPVRDPDDFANWMFAISTWLFYPTEDNPFEQLGRDAAERLNRTVECAIARARLDSRGDDTVVERLIRLERDGVLDADQSRVILVGMITGFVPTNTMAGAHMLDVLLSRPALLKEARNAALSSHPEADLRLRRCLFEAMRFKPLSREPQRFCREDYTLAAGERHQTRLRKGAVVFPLTRSAMLDERVVTRPRAFEPDRPAAHSMLFGHGLHRCIGAQIAETQLTFAFKPLLQQRGLQRAPGKAGTLQLLGPFPKHLHVQFD